MERSYHESFAQIYKANLNYIRAHSTANEETEIGTNGQASSSSPPVKVGKPKEATDQIAFIVMPFSEKAGNYPEGFYDEVLENLITPAAVEAGFEVETARREGSDIIQSTIVNDLLNADLVVADLSDHNPNVLFELGLRMASEKPTALIRAEGTKPIFDVDNMLRVCDYDPNLWKSTIERDLPKMSGHIKATWDNRDSVQSYMEILTDSQ